MAKYLVLLKGINVGGKHIVKMAELKTLLLSNGYKNVSTYIQSGNVVLEHNTTNTSKLSADLSKILKNNYSFEIPAIVFTVAELQAILHALPFVEADNAPVPTSYIGFVQNAITPTEFSNLDTSKYLPEQIALGEKCVYYYYPIGAGKAKLTSAWLDKQLKCISTLRNLNTCRKLLDL
jgi:uncharacterized protein (DUF1697 family)